MLCTCSGRVVGVLQTCCRRVVGVLLACCSLMCVYAGCLLCCLMYCLLCCLVCCLLLMAQYVVCCILSLAMWCMVWFAVLGLLSGGILFGLGPACCRVPHQL